MSEYWKSTPKYWCKQCGIYVRDTKLERANHESTTKHQNALKRSLRDLHRGHEREEKEKDRAKREIDRLNGVVSATPPSNRPAQATSKASGGVYETAPPRSGPQATEAERQQQLEQLADLGVSIPTELRGGMAMAGDWTVTSTRVVKGPETAEYDEKPESLKAQASGARKRERESTEEDKEEEKVINSLFKKPRNWGRDTRVMPTDDDAELEQLLGTPLVKADREKHDVDVAQTKTSNTSNEHEAISQSAATALEPIATTADSVKREPDLPDLGAGHPDLDDLPRTDDVVVFKKRKTKQVRKK